MNASLLRGRLQVRILPGSPVAKCFSAQGTSKVGLIRLIAKLDYRKIDQSIG